MGHWMLTGDMGGLMHRAIYLSLSGGLAHQYLDMVDDSTLFEIKVETAFQLKPIIGRQVKFVLIEDLEVSND